MRKKFGTRESIPKMTIEKIAGIENQRADFLAKIGSSLIDCKERKITVMGLGRGDSVFAISDVLEDWRSPIILCWKE